MLGLTAAGVLRKTRGLGNCGARGDQLTEEKGPRPAHRQTFVDRVDTLLGIHTYVGSKILVEHMADSEGLGRVREVEPKPAPKLPNKKLMKTMPEVRPSAMRLHLSWVHAVIDEALVGEVQAGNCCGGS